MARIHYRIEKGLEQFLFTRYDASKNSLARWADASLRTFHGMSQAVYYGASLVTKFTFSIMK